MFSIDMLHALVQEDLGPVNEPYLSSDMGVEQAARLWLSRSLLKKYRGHEDERAAELAIEKFLFYNEKCRTMSLAPKGYGDDLIINGVKDLLSDWLHPGGLPIGYGTLSGVTGLGSGSSVGAELGDFYTKLFSSRLTAYTEGTFRLYRSVVSGNPTWAAAENRRHAEYGNLVIGASKTTTVRKESGIRRTICSESILDMFFQRAIGNTLDYITKRRTGIDLSLQPELNREYARLGSLYGDYCTIDLKSASDCEALSTISEVFPRYFVDILKRHRAQRTLLPGGSEVELHMVSTMGNGFTFSLMTMLLSAIVCVCYRLGGDVPVGTFKLGRGHESNNFGVFGDDIVVTRRHYEKVVRALELFGFEVNDDKSFNNGHFRESCGEDYFKGVNIRGVYLKTARNDPELFSVINRLTRWAVTHNVDMSLTLQYLLACVRWLITVPRDVQDIGGWHVPECVALPDFYDIGTRSPFYRAHTAVSRSWVYPVAVPTSESSNPKAHKMKKRRKPKKLPFSTFIVNDDGALVSLVGGFLCDGRFGIRSDPDAVIRTKVQQGLTPNWDRDPAGLDGRDKSWQAFVVRLHKGLITEG